MKECPHIGDMIKQHIKEKRYRKSAWGREHGVAPATVYGYQKRRTMRTDTLFAICQTLQYNFFKDLAAALPEQLPPHPVSEHGSRIKELEEQVKQLELQNATLKEALKLVGSG